MPSAKTKSSSQGKKSLLRAGFDQIRGPDFTNQYLQSIRGEPIFQVRSLKTLRWWQLSARILGKETVICNSLARFPTTSALGTNRHKLNDSTTACQLHPSTRNRSEHVFLVQYEDLQVGHGRCVLSLRPSLRDLHRRRALLAHALGIMV